MKKSFVFILIILFFSSCSKNSFLPESESKNSKVALGIVKLLSQNNSKAAYLRMDESFRIIVSENDFIQNWEKISIGCSDLIEIKMYDGAVNNSYSDVYSVIKFKNKSVYAKFSFIGQSLFPVGVEYDLYEKKSFLAKLESEKKDALNVTGSFENLEPLKDLCKDYFKIGFGINGYNEKNCAIEYPEFMIKGNEQFSSCTLTNMMKPVYILDQKKSVQNYKDSNSEPVLSFSSIDKTLKWCKDNNLKMRGHTLVWHTQTPLWFFSKEYNEQNGFVGRDEMIMRLDSFVRQYLSYVQSMYPGVVYCWDVVNEAVDPSKGDVNSFFMCRMENDSIPNYWYKTIGNDYPEIAFSIARKYAQKDVKLFYNDYGTTDSAKRECIFKLCDYLNKKGLIDGIGMQGYWDFTNPSLKTIKDTINRFSETGLEIQITELTVSAPKANDEDFNSQALRYAGIMRLLQKLDKEGGGNANITAVTFFGLMDGYPLYGGSDTTTSRLFDSQLNPKPAYFAVQETLKKFYKKELSE